LVVAVEEVVVVLSAEVNIMEVKVGQLCIAISRINEQR
jgi:hypothetical protein